MAHKRTIAPSRHLEGTELTSALAGIGMRFAADPQRDANIEDTILAASIEGMERDDLRVLALLTTWLGIHSDWINADRLFRLTEMQTSPRVKAFWSAFAKWQSKDHRFARLERLHRGSPVDLLQTGTEFQVRRRGEDERFIGSALRVPAQVLRDRRGDVLSPPELAAVHAAYRWRIIMGPTYRADMWAAIEANPSLNIAEVARLTYGSFATAWRARRDYVVLNLRR